MQFWKVARRGMAAGAVLALALLGLGAPTAFATFHEMSIREVYPGSAAMQGSEYVELQMWASGQNFVGGHLLRTYGSDGGVIESNPFAANVASGADQSTIVMATPEAEAQFGIIADGSLSPSGQLDPAGGAVCWESIDCVSWGDFKGSLPSPAGSPAAAVGIPDGMALRRTIAPGCPSRLDPTDDSDNSASDFAAVFPEPRPNSVPAPAGTCAPGAGYGGSGDEKGGGAPQTRLRRKPGHKTRDRTPTFSFSSSEPGSRFQCKLDRKPFRSCRSPLTTRRLTFGAHTFRVRARGDSGKPDPTPATYRFRVVRRR
jgi:hypothetical protein